MHTYFSDLRFVNAAVMPGCKATIDRSFPGTWSIEFLLAGRMHYAIDDGPALTIDTPTLFWHRPGPRYRYGADDGRGWDHHWVLMAGARARRLVEIGLDPLATYGCLPVAQAGPIASLLREIVGLVRDHDPRRHPRAVALTELLVATAQAEAHRANEREADRPLRAIADRLRADPAKDWDFHRIATGLGLSYGRFRQRYRILIGRAPHDDLLETRMRSAANLLATGDLAVTAIARQVGCPDAARFAKLFKQRIGVSPRAYRAGLPR